VEKEGYRFVTPMQVDLKVTKLEPEFYIKGKLEFTVEQTCARCAETFPLSIRHPFDVAMAKLPQVRVRGTEIAEKADTLDVNFFEGNEIALNPIIEEQFFLSIPYQSLCRQECKGMCQKCGMNRNIKECGCKAVLEVSPFAALEGLL
jgi:uncharacterized protein